MFLHLRRKPKRALRVLLLLQGSLVPGIAYADGRVQFLAERLSYPPPPGKADDFRIRTNAALALGATADEEAVTPLCLGLADPSDAVRQAASFSLRRLARASAASCLKARLPIETSTAVKAEIRRAIDAVDRQTPDATDKNSERPGNVKYYVSLSRVANQSARDSFEVDRLVHDAIAARLGQSGEYEIAPSGETPDLARSTLVRRRLKGYYLSTSVEKFEYADDGLRVRIKIAVFSYPGKDLRGEVPASGTMPGARPGDRNAEDQLMALLAARAAELFAQNFR
jgi:hypothetical protein